MTYTAKGLNPSNAEATFVHFKHKDAKIFESHLNRHIGIHGSCGVFSDEYPCARVSVIFFRFFASFSIGQIRHQQHEIRVRPRFNHNK